MTSQAKDRATREAFDLINAGLDRLDAAGVRPVDAEDAVTVTYEVEQIGRRVRKAQIDVIDEIDRAGFHQRDGHKSAKVMVRHVAGLSAAEANRREQTRRALRDLPVVADALAAGRIGAPQVERIARVWANPRVREELELVQGPLVELAAVAPYLRFDAELGDWERLTDQDGTADTATRTHANRDGRFVQDYDGGWCLTAGFGSLQGAQLYDIYRRFEHEEWEKDWAEARAEHGAQAVEAHLARTPAQRRADAIARIFLLAADAQAAAPGGSVIVTNVVMDYASLEEHVARLVAADPGVLSRLGHIVGLTVPDASEPEVEIDEIDHEHEQDRRDDNDEIDDAEPQHEVEELDEPHEPQHLDDDDNDETGPDAASVHTEIDVGTEIDVSTEIDVRTETAGTDRNDLAVILGAADSPRSGEPPPARGLRPEGIGPDRDGFRCSTLDGHPIDPTEAAIQALHGQIRRVVVGSDSVVIDLGRRSRLFRGAALLAVRLAETHCIFVACDVPASRCQGGHTMPWVPTRVGDEPGQTNPGNGGNECSHHNRLKQKEGFTTARDDEGQWHTYRPDGTEIPGPGRPPPPPGPHPGPDARPPGGGPRELGPGDG